MDEVERQKAIAWAKKEAATRDVHLHFPDREKGEPSATQKQLDYIRHLSPGIDGETLVALGKWQASALIDEIKYQQDKMSQDLADEYFIKKEQPKETEGRNVTGGAVVILIVIVLLVVAALNR